MWVSTISKGANDNAVMAVMQFKSKQAKAERADYEIHLESVTVR